MQHPILVGLGDSTAHCTLDGRTYTLCHMEPSVLLLVLASPCAGGNSGPGARGRPECQSPVGVWCQSGNKRTVFSRTFLTFHRTHTRGPHAHISKHNTSTTVGASRWGGPHRPPPSALVPAGDICAHVSVARGGAAHAVPWRRGRQSPDGRGACVGPGAVTIRNKALRLTKTYANFLKAFNLGSPQCSEVVHRHA